MRWKAVDVISLSAVVPTPANRRRLRQLAESGPDWDEVVGQAARRGTAGLLDYNLGAAGLLDCVPPPARVRLEAERRLWAAKEMLYAVEAKKLLSALHERGIGAFALKGMALILGGYYPAPGLRAVSDIDLLIADHQLREAEQVAAELGYAVFEPHELKSPRMPTRLPQFNRHLPARRGLRGTVLELHYRAFHHPETGRDLDYREVARRLPLGQFAALPAAEDLCLHLIEHTVYQVWGAGSFLRTLADLHFGLAADPQARERLVERAEELRFGGAVSLALAALDFVAGEWESPDEGLEGITDGDAIRLLLETATGRQAGLADAARLVEYLDLRRRGGEKLRHLWAAAWSALRRRSPSSEPPRGPTISIKSLNPWILLRAARLRGTIQKI